MTQVTPQAREIPTANRIPECFDGRRVLGEGDSESYHKDQFPESDDIHPINVLTINLFMVLHVQKRVVVEVTEESDVWPGGSRGENGNSADATGVPYSTLQ